MLLLRIPLEPVTKKNSQQIIMVKGRPIIIPSKKYKQYEKECGEYIPEELKIKIDYPVNVECHFYMSTHRRVDITNLLQAILDILCAYDVIDDDNRNIVYSVDGSRVFYDKDNPRTEIRISRKGGDIDIWEKK